MINDWNSDVSLGVRMVPQDGNAWMCTLSRYNRQGRWVNKGPVFLHFLSDTISRLVGNYMYGTKSIALNFQSIIELTISFRAAGLDCMQ